MSELTISPEGAYTDIEHDFIENEPPGLFPGGQDSTWGQIRSVYAAYLQVLADTMTKWYGNLDPATVSSDDIPEWEYMLNLPQSNTALTDLARRNNVIARFQIGPFTRTRRRNIVEAFISQTLGQDIVFVPEGIPYVSAGIPFYSGIGSLAGTYAIRENQPLSKNLVPNSNFETNVSGWSASSGGSNGLTLGRYPAAPPMFGAYAADCTCQSTGSAWMNTPLLPVTPGATYTQSAYVYRLVGARGIGLQISWYTATGTLIYSDTPTAVPTANHAWVRLALTAVAPPTATQAIVFITFGGGTQAANDEYFVDGVQFERVVSKNLFWNGDAEIDYTANPGWHDDTTVSGNGGTKGFSMDRARFGNRSFKIVNGTNPNPYVYSDKIVVAQGETLTSSIYVYALQPTTFGWVTTTYDVGDNIQQEEFDSVPIVVPPGSWVRLQQTYTIANPASAGAYPSLIAIGLAPGGTVYYDGFQTEFGSVATDFVPTGPTDYVDPAANPFFYEVRIINTVTVDLAGLTRELARITPAGITFAINSVATP